MCWVFVLLAYDYFIRCVILVVPNETVGYTSPHLQYADFRMERVGP